MCQRMSLASLIMNAIPCLFTFYREIDPYSLFKFLIFNLILVCLLFIVRMPGVQEALHDYLGQTLENCCHLINCVGVDRFGFSPICIFYLMQCFIISSVSLEITQTTPSYYLFCIKLQLVLLHIIFAWADDNFASYPVQFLQCHCLFYTKLELSSTNFLKIY